MSTFHDSFGETEKLFFSSSITHTQQKTCRFLRRVQGRKIDPVSFGSRCVFGWIEGCECVLQDGRAGVFTVRISEDWTDTHTRTHTRALLCPEREKDGRVDAQMGVTFLVRVLLFLVFALRLALR